MKLLIMAKSTINKQQLFLEFISVVFAVLLALFLNGWRESMKTNELVERVQHTIKEEVAHNREEVEAVIGYHRNLVRELRQNTHLINKIPIKGLPFNIASDKQFENYFRELLLFNSSSYTERLEVHSNAEKRIVVMDDHIFQTEVKNDTLYFYGMGNIQLRTAGISNNAWGIAEATNVLVELDLEIVSNLSRLKSFQEDYIETSGRAINMIYKGETGVTSILEDMVFYETKMLEIDSILLLKMSN